VRTEIKNGQRHKAFRDGDTFIKYTAHPHIEEAASRFLGHLGVHAPAVTAHGDHLTAPWVAGKDLIQSDTKELQSISASQAAHTLFGEWLGGISDRHCGNYLVADGTVHSIDHGEAFRSYPDESDLYTAMIHPLRHKPGHPGFWTTPIPAHALEAAHDPVLEEYVKAGTAHLSEASASACMAAFRDRLDQVHPQMTVGHLLPTV